MKITLGVEGMSCAACSSGLEKHLNAKEGVISASVNLVMANATVEYDEKVLTQSKIEGFIKEAGFKSTGLFVLKDENKQHRTQKILLIAYGALTVVLLYLTMGTMIGLPVPKFIDMHVNAVAYTAVLFAITLAYLVYGSRIFLNGIKTLFHRAPNMDTLVTMGVLSSFGYSVYVMIMIFTGHHMYVDSLYFESCCVIIYFIRLGRFIDRASKNKTKQAIKDLVQITPSKAVVRRDGAEKEVTIDEVVKGDIVVCRPGEKIAVDGTIVSGSAHLDESFISGESKPASKKEGDVVIAGSINYDGYIEYSAERIGRDSTISEIVHLVVEATNTKMPIAKIADRVSGIFVPVVMGIAVLALIVSAFFVPIGEAITTFVTVLVVACPCSLGLATPLAIVVSEGKCAQRGILVKKSETLEIASKANAVVFDKTGTLTYGKLKISGFFCYDEPMREAIVDCAVSLESMSSHPISAAFDALGAKKYEVEDFRNMGGYGISGRVDGRNVMMGNAKMLDRFCIDNVHSDDENALAQKGNSIVYVVIDGEVKGLFGVNDLIKDNAKEAIKRIKGSGREVIMLTGDNQATAEMIAKELGIDRVVANVLPSEKADLVKGLKREGKTVIMCGDGINDSPALASADIGVSVHNGTDIAMNSSDVILMRDDLNRIVDLLKVGKRTVANIKQNLFWAFFYNCLMIPIALGALKWAGVVINPMIAGLAMVLSSLTVIFNALRLRLIKFDKGE